jgi:hypothetical protein
MKFEAPLNSEILLKTGLHLYTGLEQGNHNRCIMVPSVMMEQSPYSVFAALNETFS